MSANIYNLPPVKTFVKGKIEFNVAYGGKYVIMKT